MVSKKQIKKEVLETENVKCQKCNQKFGVDINYLGIITCPYCGGYVEG